MFLRIFFFFHLQGWSYYSLNIPIYLYYIYDKQILNISGHLLQFACRTWAPCQHWPSPVPHPLEHPNPAQGPASPWDHQLLPHWGCSRARLQLPRTLPCLAPASVKPGPLVGPCPGPSLGLSLWRHLVTCGWGCSGAPGWGIGTGPRCHAPLPWWPFCTLLSVPDTLSLRWTAKLYFIWATFQ